MEAASTTLAAKIFWSTLEYVGSGSVITLFLIFAIYFTHHQSWLTRRRLALLWALPIFNIFLVTTNTWHGLVWTGFRPDPGAAHVVIYEHGIGFFWVMVCVYLYVLAGVILLLNLVRRPAPLYRRQASIALVGAVVPLGGGTLYMLDLTPPGLNITPLSFMITGIIYFASLFHYRLFDLVPVARDVLIENLSEGVVVLDTRYRIVDLNPAAAWLLGMTNLSIGQVVPTIPSPWAAVLADMCDASMTTTKLLSDDTIPRYVELKTTPLRDRYDELNGWVLILRDITENHQIELELRQANDRLKHQLQQIERLQVKLQEQAIRDGLTGVYNRRYFDETLAQELLRANQEGYPVAIILLDIDYFKKINDTYGHKAGDRVLQVFGKLLYHHNRASDIVCRYGGEEFVVVLPGMELEQAYQRANEIRVAFQTTSIWFNQHQISTSVSAGVGIFPAAGTTADELMQATDRALYAAKSQGRNCIRWINSRLD